jgi:hypothetical protein
MRADRRNIVDESSRTHYQIAMNSEKARRLLAAWTCVFGLISLTALAEETASAPDEDSDGSGPRFVSPDGKYGLLVTDRAGDSMSDRVELIELATKRLLVVLNDPEAPERSDKARLDWSKDSKRVAAFTGTRVDGSVSILVRDGDGFAHVKLPKLPELPNPEEPSAAFRKKHKFKFLKWITTDSLEFVRWLPSGDVELKYYNEVATKEGGGFRSQINVTVAIDAKNHATLKKVSREESLE